MPNFVPGTGPGKSLKKMTDRVGKAMKPYLPKTEKTQRHPKKPR